VGSRPIALAVGPGNAQHGWVPTLFRESSHQELLVGSRTIVLAVGLENAQHGWAPTLFRESPYQKSV
jgi:hypothetical protein